MIYKKAVEVMKFHLWYAAPAALSWQLGQADAVLPQARLSRHRPRPAAPMNSELDPDTRASAAKQGKSLDEIVAAKPTAATDAAWGNGFRSPKDFIGDVYQGV